MGCSAGSWVLSGVVDVSPCKDILVTAFVRLARESHCSHRETPEEAGVCSALFHFIEAVSSGGVRSGVEPRKGSEA